MFRRMSYLEVCWVYFRTSLVSKSLRDVHTSLRNIQLASILRHINLSTLTCPPPIGMNCKLNQLGNISDSGRVQYVRHGRSSSLYLLYDINNMHIYVYTSAFKFFTAAILYSGIVIMISWLSLNSCVWLWTQ